MLHLEALAFFVCPLLFTRVHVASCGLFNPAPSFVSISFGFPWARCGFRPLGGGVPAASGGGKAGAPAAAVPGRVADGPHLRQILLADPRRRRWASLCRRRGARSLGHRLMLKSPAGRGSVIWVSRANGWKPWSDVNFPVYVWPDFVVLRTAFPVCAARTLHLCHPFCFSICLSRSNGK